MQSIESFEPELEIEIPSEDTDLVLDFIDDEVNDIELPLPNDYEQVTQTYKQQFDDFYYYNSCYSIYMNKCCRSEMQDRFQIIPKFDCSEKLSYLAVFDGHGSDKIAEFLSNHLHEYIINSSNFKNDIPKAIMEGFKQIDDFVQKCSELMPEENGSVVLCGIIFENQLYLANLGDSKAILIKNNDHFQELTQEQTPSRADEQKRIEELGGWVIPIRNQKRLQGQIDVSRSIGDKKYKPFIIPDPEISKYQLSYEDKYLIIATDGLWNEVSAENIVEYSKNSQSISDLPKVIFDQSQSQKTIKDNTTILCLDIKQYLDQIYQIKKQTSDLT